ncbi:MAG TPA: hypothetical protein VLO11_03480, partial [Luteolibacter sp.]|nr:hypothetical protein [Luteolibacter sp.]
KPIHLLSATVLLLAACKESPQASTPASGEASSADKVVLESVLNATPEGEAKAISEVKASAKPGDEVTVTGRIMGHVKPFVEGRAAFILADPSLITACSDNPGDECGTPWDACCDSPEDKKKAIATIQIVNADGRVLKQGLEGANGLANLATVTVSGQVAAGSAGDLLIVNASAIGVAPSREP